MKIAGVCIFCIDKIWQVIALLLVTVAVVISVLKYTLPNIGAYREDMQQWVAENYGANITIGNITAGWQGTGPVILLQYIELLPDPANSIDLTIKEIRVKVDFWQSIIERQVSSDYFILDGVSAQFDARPLLLKQSNTASANSTNPQQVNNEPLLDALSQLFLGQLKQFSMVNSKILLTTPDNTEQLLLIEQLTWTNDLDRHQGVGEFKIANFAANSLSFVLDLTGQSRSTLAGQLFIEADELDVSPWLGQTIEKNTKLIQSNINFTAWMQIKRGLFGHAQLQLGNNEIRWSRNHQSQSLSLNQGQVIWTPSTDGWKMTGVDIQFSAQDQHWPNIQFQLANQDQQYDLYVEQWALDTMPLLLSLAGFSDQVVVTTTAYQPHGVVQDLYLQYRSDSDYKVTAAFTDLGWANQGQIPGAAGLNGHFGLVPDRGWLSVKGDDNHLLTGDLFKEPIRYDRFNVDLTFHRDHQQVWHVGTDELRLHNDELHLVAEFDLALAELPTIDLYAEVSVNDVNQAWRYYPEKYMGKSTVDYLNGALKGGQIPFAQMIWTGSLANFPYDNKQGLFYVNAMVEGVELLFTAGWPVISNINGNLMFKNDSLTIVPTGGYFMDIDISERVVATIPSLSQGDWLNLEINTVESVAKVAKLFKSSPLRDIFEPIFTELTVAGDVVASTTINIPLSSNDVTEFEQRLGYKGTVNLNANGVDLKTLDIQLTDTLGVLKFDRDKIWTEQMTAQWLGFDFATELQGHYEPAGYQLNITVDSLIQSQQVQQQFAMPLVRYFGGSIPVRGEVDLAFPDSGLVFNSTITADFAGATSTLPAPYGKTSGQPGRVDLLIQGDTNTIALSGNYAQQLFFNGELLVASGQFSQAHLILGQEDLGLVGNGFKITVDLNHGDILPWYHLADEIVAYAKQSSSGAKGILPMPQNITGKIQQLSGFGQTFHGLNFEAKEGNGNWDVLVNAKEARANIHFDRDWLGQGIRINSDYLRWSTHGDKVPKDDSSGFNSAAFIRGLPPLSFTCLDCKLGDYDLQRVDFKTQTVDQQLNLTQLIVGRGKGKNRDRLEMTGTWLGDENGGRTTVKGAFNSKNFGGLLAEYNLTSAVRDSLADISFFANWSGGFHQFNTPSLNGEVKWQLSEGHFTEVSDKGVRLFSLLSLDSIIRKLKLDFRDVFSKGFFYNSMKGTMLIDSGIAYTNDTVIDGVPGNMSLIGSTNLVDSTLDYQLAFTPKYTSSLPTLIAFLVNPISGIAALGLNEVFESKVISRVHFSLKGSISDPLITETGRKSKDIKLPEKVVSPFMPIDPADLELPKGAEPKPLVPSSRSPAGTPAKSTPATPTPANSQLELAPEAATVPIEPITPQLKEANDNDSTNGQH